MSFSTGVKCCLSSPSHVPEGATVGIVAYGVDFFATQEREIAFRKWMGSERPDVVMKQVKFANQLPPWIALPGLAVTQGNVVEASQVVWHSPAPPNLIKARRGREAF
jgi:ribose transport system substrate-binding protein